MPGERLAIGREELEAAGAVAVFETLTELRLAIGRLLAMGL